MDNNTSSSELRRRITRTLLVCADGGFGTTARVRLTVVSLILWSARAAVSLSAVNMREARENGRPEVDDVDHGRGRVLPDAENGRSAQAYGVIWDVSTEGADARIASA